MPKIKPILFNTEMVKAILDGRKTVTRRVCKITVNAGVSVSHNFCETCCYPEVNKDGICVNFFNADKIYVGAAKPPCQPGDILYVRETWQQNYDGSYAYRAGHKFECEKGWRPSIHMPKEAARIFLRVTNVRVERLQEITEDGVCEEGAGKLISCPNERTIYYPEGGMEACFNTDVCFKCDYIDKSYPELFGEIVWNSTIKPRALPLYGWIANPWVWVIEFERINREDI